MNAANRFQSPLEQNPDLLARFILELDAAFGPGTEVAGILEIGSFAKGEAVPTSDIDTRIYVKSTHAYRFNPNALDHPPPVLYDDFVAATGSRPYQAHTWEDFNIPIAELISQKLDCSLEFGFVDQRYALYELTHLDRYPSPEHSFLMQSNILYDPSHRLGQVRAALMGNISPIQAAFYQQRHLRGPSPRLHALLDPDSWELQHKLRKSGQIPWVQYAVRSLRDAVVAKSYAQNGTILYRKPDVLRFYQHHLPEEYPTVDTLYQWKTNRVARTEMVQRYLHRQQEYQTLFRAMMPHLARIVDKVARL